jgi:hypothetical protein
MDGKIVDKKGREEEGKFETEKKSWLSSGEGGFDNKR